MHFKIKKYTALFCLSFTALLSFGAQAAAQPVYCQNTDAGADVVIMMDVTGSNTAANIAEQKAAILNFINTFNAPSVTVKPFIAAGSFNHNCVIDTSGNLSCTGDPARILPNGSLTDNYGAIGGAPDLVDAVNNVTGGGPLGRGIGGTNLEAALEIARQELNANGSPSRPDYVVIISDGNPNLPGFSTNPACTSCVCAEAEDAADLVTQLIESPVGNSGQVFAVYYNGGNVGCADEGGQTAGYLYMQNRIASNPAYFYNGLLNINDIFKVIAKDITCQDDGNQCTVDFCDTSQNPGVCVNSPDTTDSDGDGVPNCQDQCPGASDGLLGTSCSAGTGACEQKGLNVCSGTSIQCDAVPGTGSEEICDGIDNDCDGEIDEGTVCCTSRNISSVQFALDSNADQQMRLNTRAAKRLIKAANGKKKLIAFAEKVKTESDKLFVQSWNTAWSLPPQVLSCSSGAITCSNIQTFDAQISAYSSNAEQLFGLLEATMKRLIRLQGRNAKSSKLLKQGKKALTRSKETLLQVPAGSNICQISAANLSNRHNTVIV